MMRPQLRSRIEGRYRSDSRAPLKTFTLKKCCQSASLMSSNARTSKIPKLFTRMSTCGCVCTNFSATCATLKSPAKPSTLPWVALFMAVTAASTAAEVRPLTITVAPSRASAAAMALPMPAVDPLTSAIFFASCRSITAPGAQSAYFGRLQRRIHRHRIKLVDDAFLHDEAHPLHQADVIDRIAGHRHYIGDLAGRNR